MSKKTLKCALIFSITAFLFFLVSMFLNRNYFNALAYDNVFLYQTKQLLAIILLFVIGLGFLLIIKNTLSMPWIMIFSFPIGSCLWAFSSLILLLLGIPYTFFFTILLIGIFLLLLTFILIHFQTNSTTGLPLSVAESFRHHATVSKLSQLGQPEAFPFLLLFLGLAFLASSGFIYSFVSYDSFFYFTNYGHTLTIVNNFKDIAGNNSYTLTNISQFLPMLNAYTSFWGLDQCFQLQAFLTSNVLVCFFYGIYQYCLKFSSSTKPTVYSFLLTLLLASSTAFITTSSWVLANMYCMAYIFFLFAASFLGSHLELGNKEAMFLISFCFTALTLLRKDGIIFASFFLICFCSIQLFTKKQLSLLFLPAVIAEIWWLFYVRVILNASVKQATFSSIANNKNIFFVACIIIGTWLYLHFIHDLLLKINAKITFFTEYTILFAGMVLLFIASFFLKDANTIIDNVDFVIRNMFRYPSSWGISAFFFGIVLTLSLVKEFRLDYLHFLWSGYAFLNLISYCIVDSKWFWLNWDDSYNRVLLQIVPVFVFIMAIKLEPIIFAAQSLLRLSDTQDHSSES